MVSEFDLADAADLLIKMGLAEDLGLQGDVTSVSTIAESRRIRGKITAKQAGVMAGLPLVVAVYQQVDAEVQVILQSQDGDVVEIGTVVCEIEGSARSVLTGERVAINFLQRLSGIATMTAQFVTATQGTHTRILDTRKTTPGWRALEKYAVRMGGALNHRVGLYDMVLIKDNHIDAAGGITAAVTAARQASMANGLPIEVEVKTLEELREALALKVDRIMLDNMSEDMMREAVQIVGGRVPLEASGNMTLARVAAVAATGVDFISVGALTHSAPSMDLSMRLVMT
jgi:nicotinate-nucleotide pyrophosphorylase (carboxylating)